MEIAFEELIAGYLEDNIGISNEFLSLDLSVLLKSNLVKHFKEDKFKNAGIGNDLDFQKNDLIRKDKIFWLDRAHNDAIENSFFDFIDSFVLYLNQTCFTGITGYEFHYALYEEGSFYKRHLDQFRFNKGRIFSMIMYLNSNWIPTDGGELMIFQGDESTSISPLNRKCIFFKSSELEHEVLLTNKPRMSITGWLKVN
jgi:SM-20-related protein